jgi:hypothetical protein
MRRAYTIGYEAEEEKEYMVNNAVNATQGVLLTEILLNNQADISIVHPALLTNVHQSKKNIRVKGVGASCRSHQNPGRFF